jgi:large subunit ribosomal protein L14
MIHKQTKLVVADNSGIIQVQCIHVKRGKSCGAGDIIKVCVKEISPSVRAKYWKSTLNAVVVRTRSKAKDASGSYTSFSDNAVVILDEKYEPIGTRVFGAISRKVKIGKVVSMAPVVY